MLTFGLVLLSTASIKFESLENREKAEVEEKFRLLYKQNYEDIPWFASSSTELSSSSGLEDQEPVPWESLSSSYSASIAGGNDNPESDSSSSTDNGNDGIDSDIEENPEDDLEAYWAQCAVNHQVNASTSTSIRSVDDPCECYENGLSLCYKSTITMSKYSCANSVLIQAFGCEKSFEFKTNQAQSFHKSNLEKDRESLETCSDLGESTQGPLLDLTNRVNLYRYLAGLSPVKLLTKYNKGCQKVAKAHEASNVGATLSHSLSGFSCADSEAIEYASKSNLYYRGAQFNPVDAIDAWMDDSADSTIGHRRWILHPPLGSIGYGMYSYYAALRVIDTESQAYPDIPFIAYPSPGYFPSELIYSVFTFSLPNTYYSSSQSSKFTLKEFKVDDQDCINNVTSKKLDRISGVDETFSITLKEDDSNDSLLEQVRDATSIYIMIEVSNSDGTKSYEYTIKPFWAGSDQYCICSYCSSANVCRKNGCPRASKVIQISNEFFRDSSKSDVDQRYGCYQYLNNDKGCGAMSYITQLVKKSNNNDITFYTIGSDGDTYKRGGLDFTTVRLKNIHLRGTYVPYGKNSQWITLYREESNPNSSKNISLRKTQFAASNSGSYQFSTVSDISFESIDLDWFTATELPNRWSSDSLYIQAGDQPEAVYVLDDCIKIKGRTSSKIVTIAPRNSNIANDDNNRVIYTNNLFIVTASKTVLISTSSSTTRKLRSSSQSSFEDFKVKFNSGSKVSVEVEGDLSSSGVVKEISLVNPVGTDKITITTTSGSSYSGSFFTKSSSDDVFPEAPDQETFNNYITGDTTASSSKNLNDGEIAGIVVV